MALPKISYPTFDVHLKSLNKKVKFRPFLVKEEKLLLMAKEAEDLPSLLDTVKQIINNCCLEDINVDELPLFEIELVFIHLRLKSVGENLELTYKCENIVEEQPCGASMTFEVDLSQVTIEEPESHTNKIMITEDIGVMLKYPSLKISSSMAEQVNSIENIVDLIYEHLDYVFDDTSKYDAESITKEELYEFLGSMSLDQLEPFKEFFSTLPYVKAEKDIQCEKCGYQHKIVVRGIDDFFG
jgi:T4 bacteriophage base plate protein